MRPFPAGIAATLILTVGVLAAGCDGATTDPGPEAGDARTANATANGYPGALVRTACRVPREQLLRIARGTRLDRSGELQILPEEPNFVSAGFSHAGPWDYVQEVPLLWYGPGFVRPGVYERPVTLADIAPTQAELLDFDFHAPDGRPMTEALLPAAERDLPKLLVTVIWDSAGRWVLDEWPHDWPYLRRLISRSAWFEHASAGASPANTPPSHATIGTGAFPDDTGVVDEYIRLDGEFVKPYEVGPRALLEPTLADLYDPAMDNEPIVGTVATLDPHVGMMGHGALWGGGDRDIGVTRQAEEAQTGGDEGVVWNLTSSMAPYYRLPDYVNDTPGLDEDVAELDRADGSLDGEWRSNSIEQLAGGFDTPARTPYQTRLVKRIVEREGFGQDEVPDLLFLNYKAMDTIGHMFSANGVEMSDAIQTQDRDLRDLVGFLDRTVGRGAWAMVLTADHGHQFDPAVSGAFEIDIDELELRITEAFDDGDGHPVVEWIRPTEIWLDTGELAEGGHTTSDVAAFVLGLTKAQTLKRDRTLQPGEEDDRVFAAAFPSPMLDRLPCLEGAG